MSLLLFLSNYQRGGRSLEGIVRISEAPEECFRLRTEMNRIALDGGLGAEACDFFEKEAAGPQAGGILFKPSKACPQMCPQCSNPLEVNGAPWFVERQKWSVEQPARRRLKTLRVAKKHLDPRP